MRYLTGGPGSFLTASTLMAAAGVAWGLIEQMTGRDALAADTVARPGASGSTPPPVPMPPGAAAAAAPVVPSTVPPLPGAGVAPSPSGATRMPSHPGVPDDVARLIRLAISAARADGNLAAAEQSRIIEHARHVGAEAIVAHELRTPTAIEAILAGVTDARAKEELYTLAYAIVRADESVSGAERIYLAQLAHKLGLTPAAAARLEAEAAAAIDRATPDDAPPGER
jgi:hypothetical protein